MADLSYTTRRISIGKSGRKGGRHALAEFLIGTCIEHIWCEGYYRLFVLGLECYNCYF